MRRRIPIIELSTLSSGANPKDALKGQLAAFWEHYLKYTCVSSADVALFERCGKEWSETMQDVFILMLMILYKRPNLLKSLDQFSQDAYAHAFTVYPPKPAKGQNPLPKQKHPALSMKVPFRFTDVFKASNPIEFWCRNITSMGIEDPRYFSNRILQLDKLKKFKELQNSKYMKYL